MKLRNKKTGEIIELLAKPSFVKRNDDFLQSEVNTFNSLAELNEEWEDAPEEPKEYWAIDRYSKGVEDFKNSNDDVDKFNKEIGNYFETREKAEKAVEKLKAWKRLKNKGFSFGGWNWKTQCIDYNLDYTDITEEQIEEAEKDLDLLFLEEDD